MKNIITVSSTDNSTLFSALEKSYTIIYDKTKNSSIYNAFFSDSNFNIIIKNKKIDLRSISSKKNNIEVLDKNNRLFLSNTVYENLIIRIESLKLDRDKIFNRFNKLLKMYNYDKYLYTKIENLSYGQRYLILFLIICCLKPKIIVLDDLLSYLDKNNSIITKTLLNKLNENGTTIIYFTNDIEKIFVGKEYIILKDDYILINSNKKNINNDIHYFTENNISLPFVVDLSKKLRYYIPIKQIYSSSNELVDDIWIK